MEVKKIAVIGAGLMGAGIAQVAAESGFEVYLNDVEQRFIDRGVSIIEGNLKRSVDKGKIQAADVDAVKARIKGVSRPGRRSQRR